MNLWKNKNKKNNFENQITDKMQTGHYDSLRFDKRDKTQTGHYDSSRFDKSIE